MDTTKGDGMIGTKYEVQGWTRDGDYVVVDIIATNADEAVGLAKSPGYGRDTLAEIGEVHPA